MRSLHLCCQNHSLTSNHVCAHNAIAVNWWRTYRRARCVECAFNIIIIIQYMKYVSFPVDQFQSIIQLKSVTSAVRMGSERNWPHLHIPTSILPPPPPPRPVGGDISCTLVVPPCPGMCRQDRASTYRRQCRNIAQRCKILRDDAA